MSKYKFLFISFTFIIFITLIANQIELYNSTESITGSLENTVDTSVGGVLGLLTTYVHLITFNIDGFPVIINALIFYPINLVFVYLIVEVVKDLIPFT